MKKEEIKELSTQDLKDRLEQAQKDYLQAKINHAVSPLDNPASITRDRKMIARMKTELRQRELNNKYSQEMEEKRNLRKERIGVVSSNKGDKTITVMVKWKEKHPIYGKFVNKTKKYHAHDENNECSIGDTVRLMETRPLSKTKRWRLVEIIEKVK